MMVVIMVMMVMMMMMMMMVMMMVMLPSSRVPYRWRMTPSGKFLVGHNGGYFCDFVFNYDYDWFYYG